MSEVLVSEAKFGLETAINTHLSGMHKPAFMKILDEMLRTGAPAAASSSRHGAFKGGLVAHVYDLWSISRRMSACMIDVLELSISDVREKSGCNQDKIKQQISNLAPDSVLKVCLLHDLNKVASINGDPHYIDNVLNSGSVSTQKPWKSNPEASTIPSINKALRLASFEDHPIARLLAGPSTRIRDGQASLALAVKLVPEIESMLTEAEVEAIIYHDGAYPGRDDGIMSVSSCLQMVIHLADMASAHFLC